METALSLCQDQISGYLSCKDRARYFLARKGNVSFRHVMSLSRILEVRSLTLQLLEAQFQSRIQVMFIRSALHFLDIGEPDEAALRLRRLCLHNNL